MTEAAGRNRPKGPGPRRWSRLLLGVSLCFNLLGASLFGWRLARNGGLNDLLVRLDLRNAVAAAPPHQEERRAYLQKLPLGEKDVVFLGDSLVHLGPWAEFFGTIKDRGIGGETVAEVLDRLRDVTSAQPRKVFVWVGTNDLAQQVPARQVARRLGELLDRVRAESPRTSVYLLSVAPVNHDVAGDLIQDNATIRALNEQLRDTVKGRENVAFVDLWDLLVDDAGNLKRAYTNDGLHLKLEGYLAIEARLRDLVMDE